ncbi:hypothetical protein [Motilimonas eburnea]|uniref:hypothetical protein n=1 Tax=Motilimonas eburnea TaxID=1737488 RepID=UPI001E5458F6|nr:hypothetical protein [Motilimonas eburnea]MCE2573214.1 hypothetical protein [Motilimonas eburnea]
MTRVKFWPLPLLTMSFAGLADELLLNKVCNVNYQGADIGILTFSQPWYHHAREQASYIAFDDATGVGVEIHFFNNKQGNIQQTNLAQCDRYRLLQIRSSNLKHSQQAPAIKIDVPKQFSEPFYDYPPLEHGRGMHLTPIDLADKPWQTRTMRASTVALYDTPYASDYHGQDGQPITVTFETCVVCQRDNQFDSLLSCGQWGYERAYMGGYVGWSEPEFIGPFCLNQPSQRFKATLEQQREIDYRYWLDWR